MVGIKLKAQIKGGSLQRITLFHSPQFTFEMNEPHPQLKKWLEDYSQGKWSPFPLPFKASFRDRVFQVLQNIPMGTVLTYKEVAQAAGSPGAARAVGNFCRGNLFPLIIPCHRVIPSTGGIGNYTPDPTIKKKLLQFERSVRRNPAPSGAG